MWNELDRRILPGVVDVLTHQSEIYQDEVGSEISLEGKLVCQNTSTSQQRSVS